MSITAATPYLFFDGRAQEAMEAYEEALGAQVTSAQRFGDMDESCPEAMRDRVMHASLQVGAPS
jgi:PhnB protein